MQLPYYSLDQQCLKIPQLHWQDRLFPIRIFGGVVDIIIRSTPITDYEIWYPANVVSLVIMGMAGKIPADIVLMIEFFP